MPLFLFIFHIFYITYIQSSNHIYTVNSPRPLSIPFHYIYHTSKVAVYAPAEWADTITLFHVSSLVKICTLWFKQILRPIRQPAVARKRHLTANYPTNISVSFRAGRWYDHRAPSQVLSTRHFLFGPPTSSLFH
jgi:hypothetical protein